MGLLLALFSLGYDDDSIFSLNAWLRAVGPASPVLLTLFAVACSLNYWATVEHRWHAQPAIKPGKIARALLWYTPVSNGEVLARTVVLFSACNWLMSRLPSYPLYGLDLRAVAREVPGYQLLCFSLGTLVYPLAILIGYSWARAEFRLNERGGTNPRFPTTLRFIYSPRSFEGWISLLVFYILAASVARDAVFSVAMYKRITEHLQSMLPSEMYVPTVVGMYLGGLLVFSIADLLPLYAAYRWGLAEYRSSARNRQPSQEMIGSPAKA
jgi:hypothetical protein